MKDPENSLAYDVEDARAVWDTAARAQDLHTELASLYRTGSSDRRTINLLWEKIEEAEYWLRDRGVYL